MLEELRKKAISLVDIPADYKLVIEDYFEGKDGSGEAIFSWTNEAGAEGIALSLDEQGKLLRFSLEKEDNVPAVAALSAEEARARAEQFIATHYPDALDIFTLYKTKERNGRYIFQYEQFVRDVPVENSGCFITVASDGEIVEFNYYGGGKMPEWPEEIISKEKLMEHAKSKLRFPLVLAYVDPLFHDVSELGLKLVYAPEPQHLRYKADSLEPAFVFADEVELTEQYVALPAVSGENGEKLTIEQLIGITDTMEVVREVELDEERGVVWRDRNWKEPEHDLSIKGFMERQTAGTVKALFSKKTGELRSFMWFEERNGSLNLDRNACYEKAVEFLHHINPDFHKYLQLSVTENDWQEDEEKEEFIFRIVLESGVPVNFGLVTVTVNRTTGLVDAYAGPGFDLEDLKQIPSKPAVSEEEAKEIYFSNLDFQLKWMKDYDGKEFYRLAYEACHRESSTPIRYIDAVTGALIVDIED